VADVGAVGGGVKSTPVGVVVGEGWRGGVGKTAPGSVSSGAVGAVAEDRSHSFVRTRANVLCRAWLLASS
jgi:hypothetical protein